MAKRRARHKVCLCYVCMGGKCHESTERLHRRRLRWVPPPIADARPFEHPPASDDEGDEGDSDAEGGDEGDEGEDEGEDEEDDGYEQYCESLQELVARGQSVTHMSATLKATALFVNPKLQEKDKLPRSMYMVKKSTGTLPGTPARIPSFREQFCPECDFLFPRDEGAMRVCPECKVARFDNAGLPLRTVR
jgi:hypothetical protein